MFSIYRCHDVVSRNYKFVQHWCTKREIHLCTVLKGRKYRAYVPKFSEDEVRGQHLRKLEKRVALIAGGSVFVTLGGVYLYSSMSKRTGSSPLLTVRPLVIAGPSGAGKSTLLKQLFQEFPSEFGFSVSHTSRKPRQGETTGIQMQKGIENGEFIEWAEYSSNLYGTSKQAVKDVQSEGKICVLDIDMQGVRSMKKTNLDPLYVFIQPPSIEELERRLRTRGSETEESIRQRLAIAKEEMAYAVIPGVFDHIVVNSNVDEAYSKFKEIVIKEIDALRKMPQLQP